MRGQQPLLQRLLLSVARERAPQLMPSFQYFSTRSGVWWASVASLGLGLTAEPIAHAQPPPPAVSPSLVDPGPGVVVLALRGGSLDVEAVRSALSEELGRPVVLEGDLQSRRPDGVLTISYDRSRAELVVAWDQGGQTVTRVVETSDEPSRVIADSALLAVNLVRRQVDDLLPPAETRSEPAAPSPPVGPSPPVSQTPAVVQTPPGPPSVVPPEPEHRAVTAGLFYPLATHYDAPEASTYLDFNVLHGRVGAVEGLQLGGLNVITRTRGDGARLSGLQLGYLANVVDGSTGGAQFAGLFNLTSGPATAWQAAFGVNLAGESLSGAQTSFLFNSAGRVRGVQVSAVNHAGDVDGLQIGLVNIADHLRGVSIGIVNVADDIDGVPIAPFSVTRSGGVHPTVWSGNNGLANVGVKLSTFNTYTMLFLSYHRAFELELFGGGFVVGGRIPLGAGFFTDVDVLGTYLISPTLSTDSELDRSYHEQIFQPRLRALLAYRAAHHFGLFLGVAAMGQVRSELGWDRISATVGPELFGGVEL